MAVSEARAASRGRRCSCSGRGCRQLGVTTRIARCAQPRAGHVPAGEGTHLSAAGCAGFEAISEKA